MLKTFVVFWYRRFILNFSTITAPLSELTKKGRKFEWSDITEEALQNIKNALVSDPVLANPDYERTFVIQTDASDLGMGGVLVQGEGKGNEKVVAYMSEFTSAQRKYSTTERECLAVITAIEKFRQYIEGTKFKVITDHASLLWLKNLKDPTGRLCRWALRLQPYDFEFIHRKGTQMAVADALSRAVDVVDISLFSELNDSWYNSLFKKVSENPQNHTSYRIERGVLYKNCFKKRHILGSGSKLKIVVPENQRTLVIEQCHNPPLSAHFGFHKTLEKVQRDYYWPKSNANVRDFIRNCEICKAIKPSNQIHKAPMGNFREPLRPWHMIYLDFIGPFPRSKTGNSYILTVVDSFSKFVHAHPLRLATSKQLIKFLRNNVFLIFGVPEIVVSDNGSQFVSNDFQNFLKEYSVRFWPVARYHPQANAAEAANKTLEISVRAYVKDNQDHREWDKYIPEIACAMNSSVHTSTKFTPYYINFGQHMFTSGREYHDKILEDDGVNSENKFEQLRKLVKQNLLKTYQNNKKRYDLRARPVHFENGDIVWKINPGQSNAEKYITSKLLGKIKCKIKRKIGTSSYELEDLNGKTIGIFSANQICK